MKYMLMILDADETWSEAPPDEFTADIGRHRTFMGWLQEQGIPLVSAAALHPSRTAKHLRENDGQLLLTDGPHAELKEHLGGFYVIDVPDEAAAIDAARRCPIYSSIEVRPVHEFSS